MLAGFHSWWENSKYYFENAIHARWVRIGWCGALEEVLKQVDTSNNEGSGLKYRIIKDWIEKELGEK